MSNYTLEIKKQANAVRRKNAMQIKAVEARLERPAVGEWSRNIKVLGAWK